MSKNPNGGGIPILPDPIATDPSTITLDPEVEELWSSRALLLVLLLLILSFWVSYYLKVRRIRSVHETIVALFAGMFVGIVVRLSPGNVIQNMVSFKSTILLNVLLPPIILNSGYQLKQENFFRNFGMILTFAFAGTFISAVVLGVIVYLYSLLGFEGFSLTIVECLLFGSTLSATDPVTILAIFNALHVDPKLYSVIFGESILNDAVAIVMFETLSQFHGEKIHVLSFFHGVGIFLLTFCISMALGVMFGLVCSLMLKHSELGRFYEIESCLVFLIAYTSYFFSNAFTMSGIVSLLFCGITLKHYAYHNMSHRTQRTSRYMFGMLAQLSENFIFIYLGLSLFTQTQLVYKPMFILVTAMAVCVARYCAVFPISKAINIFYRARGHRTDELPHSYQMMLFWAGLRGAVGVALAAGMKGENAVALRTTVLVTVVLTVVVFGGTIGRMIEILGIRTGVEEENEDSSDEEGGGNGNYGMISGEGEESGRPSKKSKRRSFGNGIRGGKYSAGMGMEMDREDVEQSTTVNMSDRFRDSRGTTTSDGSSRMMLDSVPPRGSSPSTSRLLSAMPDQSSDEESDSEVLPNVSTEGGVEKEGDLTRVWRDGQWFTVLDERYLLPVFSNATASRRQASRKALKAKRQSFVSDRNDSNPLEDDGLASLPGSPSLLSPKIVNANGSKRREFNGSFSDIFSSLVGPSNPTPTISPSPSPSHYTASVSQSQLQQQHKRHDSSDNFDDDGDSASRGESIDLGSMPSSIGMGIGPGVGSGSGMSHSRSRKSSPPLNTGNGIGGGNGGSGSSSLSGNWTERLT